MRSVCCDCYHSTVYLGKHDVTVVTVVRKVQDGGIVGFTRSIASMNELQKLSLRAFSYLDPC